MVSDKKTDQLVRTRNNLTSTKRSQNPKILVADWVTRVGEFSPNGWLFALDSYLKIAEVSNRFGALIPLLSWSIHFDKKGLGYILGGFS
jgi:hypothetical protein